MTRPTLLAALLLLTTPTFADVTIDTDFPGGNVIVDKIEGDTVTLHPDLRDTQGDWFYWCFRVRGAQSRTVTFKFSKSQPVGVRGPAVSADGKNWKWQGGEKVNPREFTYAFDPDQHEVFFGVGMTYTQANLDDFLRSIANRKDLLRETLCESKTHRAVEKLRFGKLDGEPKYRVLLTARHHCCEMMASHAMEGLIDAITTDDWFKQNVEVMAIPFVDKDGVEDGDQGKNRKPRDHNRDYDGTSIHPETAAIRETVPKWANGKLAVAIDLHCPTLRGVGNEFVYQVGKDEPGAWERQKRFGEILEKLNGSLGYKQANDYPFGKGWNNAANYTAGWPVGKWAMTIPGVRLATTFEIPYANASGHVVDESSGRAFGRDVAKAIKTYLEQP
jgi:hypothetical protein